MLVIILDSEGMVHQIFFLQAKQLTSIIMDSYATYEGASLLKMSGMTAELGMVD
jgi:hypothetical protein